MGGSSSLVSDMCALHFCDGNTRALKETVMKCGLYLSSRREVLGFS